MKPAVPYTSLWFGILIWVLVTGGVLTGTSCLLYQDYLFAYDSQSLFGTVERKFYQVSHGRHGTTYTPYLDYRYEVDHMIVEAKTSVRSATYSSVSVGGSLPLLYVKDEVADNRIDLPAENERIHLLSYGLAALSLFLLVSGIFVIRYHVRRNKLNRYLLARGLSCQGTVTSMNYDLVGKAQVRKYYLKFAFRDNQGRELTGKTWYLTSDQEGLWQENRPITVYFDPNNSGNFTVDLNSGSRRN